MITMAKTYQQNVRKPFWHNARNASVAQISTKGSIQLQTSNHRPIFLDISLCIMHRHCRVCIQAAFKTNRKTAELHISPLTYHYFEEKVPWTFFFSLSLLWTENCLFVMDILSSPWININSCSQHLWWPRSNVSLVQGRFRSSLFRLIAWGYAACLA